MVERETTPRRGAPLRSSSRRPNPRLPRWPSRPAQRLAEGDPRNLQNLHDLRVLAVRLDDADAAMAACRAVARDPARQSRGDERDRGARGVHGARGRRPRTPTAPLAKAHPQAIVELRTRPRPRPIAGRRRPSGSSRRRSWPRTPTDVPAQLELARAFTGEGNHEAALQATTRCSPRTPASCRTCSRRRSPRREPRPEPPRPGPGRTVPASTRRGSTSPSSGATSILALAYDRPTRRTGPGCPHGAGRVQAGLEHPDAAAVARARDRPRVSAREDTNGRSAPTSFLARRQNHRRHDVLKEFGHVLRETGRCSEGLRPLHAGDRGR